MGGVIPGCTYRCGWNEVGYLPVSRFDGFFVGSPLGVMLFLKVKSIGLVVEFVMMLL